MKKNNASNASNKKENNKAPERSSLKFRTSAEILGDKFENDNKVVFDLVAKVDGKQTVTLTIFPSDNDYDNGVVDLFGFAIRVTIRSGQNGMFLSFPSKKQKDGDYFDLVSCFDKNFHSMIKEVLAGYYSDEA